MKIKDLLHKFKKEHLKRICVYHFRIDKVFVLFWFLYLFNLTGSKAATCTALANGDWANAATWSCGNVPGCGDLIIIPINTTVTISSQQNYTGCGTTPTISIYGTLKFTNGNKLDLPCGAVIYIHAGASIVPGTGGGNSNLISICGDNVWNAGSGTLNGPGCLPPSTPGCLTTLPIELLSFEGHINKNYVDLYWTTMVEINSSHFDVERSSNALDFSKTTSVTSKAQNGNSLTKINYNFTDIDPLDKTGYYRLKHVDKDGGVTFSKIISVNFIKAKNIKFIIYPNPNNGEFIVDISGLENNHEVFVTLYDKNGILVHNTSFFTNDQNSNQFQIIPSQKLQSGVYTCTLFLEEIKYTVKVIVS